MVHDAKDAGALARVAIHEALPAGSLIVDPGRRVAELEFISAGPGNARDGNYYTPAAVKDIARLIPGRPMYVNHADPSDKARGHRDVRMKASIVREAWYAPESSAARGKVTFLPTHPWLPETLAAAPDAIQVSIDAVGYGRPGEMEGKKYRAIIEKVVAVESADWVPEAGARGRFMRFVEAEADQQLSHEEGLAMLEDMTAQELREANPALFASVADLARAQDDGGEGSRNSMDEAAVRQMIQEATAPLAEENAALREENARIAREHNQAQTQTYVSARLREADDLTDAAQSYVAQRFSEATVGPAGYYTDRDELDRAIDAEVGAYRQTLQEARPAGRSGVPTQMGGYGYVPPDVAVREAAGGGQRPGRRAAVDTRAMADINDVVGGYFGLPPATAPTNGQAPAQAPTPAGAQAE